MRKQIQTAVIAVVLAVAGTFATSNVVYAQPAREGVGPFGGFGFGRFGGGRPGLSLLRELDLTDQQRQQVKTIMQNHKSDFREVHERLRRAFEAQRAAAMATPVDEAAIRAKAADVGTAEGDLAVLMSRVRTEVFEVLTPEQQQKAQELQAKRARRREEWRELMRRFRQHHQQEQQQQPPPPAPPAQ